MSQPTTAVRQGANSPVALAFPIAARQQSRFSFGTGNVGLAAAAPTPVSPIQVPAMGYLRFLRLEVTGTITGGTSPAFTADAPFNIIQSIQLRNSAGNDIIAPISGYNAYLLNKYGAQTSQAPYADKKLGRQYSAVSTTGFHYFLDIPLEIDSTTGLGSIPALASNRSYQLALTLAPVSTALSGAPAVTVSVDATAHYWTEPVGQTQGGIAQQTSPLGLGTLSLWQTEQPPVTPGEKTIKLNNVGNVKRVDIFVLRNAAGQRIDTNGFGPITDILLDNDQMFRFKLTEWEQFLVEWYGYSAGPNKDIAGGLDTGVYALPYFALQSGMAGDPAASRSQYLPTLDASLFQLKNTFGSAASTLEIISNSVVPTSSAVLYSK